MDYVKTFDSTTGNEINVLQPSLTDLVDNSLTGSLDFGRNMYQLATQNAFNSQEAQKARDFQEYMRSTAYQATFEDMRKAGLNPYLAYSNGATSTPSTASASSASVGNNKSGQAIGNILGGLLSTVLGGAFGIAKQSIINSSFASNRAVQNAFQFARQEANKDLKVEQFKDIYSFLASQKPSNNKNPFLNSNDRKYTNKDFDDLMKRFLEED